MSTRFPWKTWISVLGLCSAASAAELVQNGGFATDLSGWSILDDTRSHATWSSRDAGGSASSGSASIVDVSGDAGSLDTPLEQCLSVIGGASYVLSGKFFVPSGQTTSGFVEIEIFWLSSASSSTCSGGYISGSSISVDSTAVAADTWITQSNTLTPPPGAVRVALRFGVDRRDSSGTLFANFDDISFAPVAGPAGALVGYLTAAGSLHGAQLSNFKTALQATNPGFSAIDTRLVYHPAGVSASAGDPEISTHILPGQTVSADDIVAALGQTGLGSIDVYSTDGQPAPVIVARVFNDGGEAGTTGFTEEIITPSHVSGGPGVSVTGILIGPSNVSKLRYNVGIRTLDQPVSVSVSVKDSSGAVVHAFTDSYPSNFFTQKSVHDFVGGFDLANDETLVITFTGGPAILFGATTDNITNDPSVQFMPYIFAIA